MRRRDVSRDGTVASPPACPLYSRHHSMVRGDDRGRHARAATLKRLCFASDHMATCATAIVGCRHRRHVHRRPCRSDSPPCRCMVVRGGGSAVCSRSSRSLILGNGTKHVIMGATGHPRGQRWLQWRGRPLRLSSHLLVITRCWSNPGPVALGGADRGKVCQCAAAAWHTWIQQGPHMLSRQREHARNRGPRV